MNKFYFLILYASLLAACTDKPVSEEDPPAQTGCSASSTGFIPINDLKTGTFTNAWGEKWMGGLYPHGSNFLPAAYKTTGIQLAYQVQSLDASGNPDIINGKIGCLSIGMSNTTQETQQFIQIAKTYTNKNPKLVLVDGAVGGMTASIISTISSSNYSTYWNTVATRLNNAGVTAKQVQVIWLKENYQKRGIMTSSVRKMMHLAFEDLGINRIQIKCATGNIPSKNIPIRLGFTLEGIEREGELLSGNIFTDLEVYSMLKRDFK